MRFWSHFIKQSGATLVVILALLSILGNAKVLALPPTQANAATGALAKPQKVQVTAIDGLTLVADYWALSADQIPAAGAPTVLYIHEGNSARQAVTVLVKPLLEADYNVLSMDWRGDPDTHGTYDTQKIVGDVQTWMDWLRKQPGVRSDAVSTLGAGVGGTMALHGCANDKHCMTVVAVAPVLRNYGFPPTESALVESAFSDSLSDRSVLLIAGQQDLLSNATEMIPFAKGEISLRLYAGSDHGEYLFHGTHNDSVIRLIIGWLDEHTPTGKS